MVRWEVPVNCFNLIGDTVGSLTLNLNQYAYIPLWVDIDFPVQVSFHVASGSTIANVTVYTVNLPDFTPNTALESDFVSVSAGWCTYEFSSPYPAGLYALAVTPSSPTGFELTTRNLFWYPNLFMSGRYYAGSYQWLTQARTFCYFYYYGGTTYRGMPFYANDSYTLSSTAVKAASVFTLDRPVTLYGVVIPVTSTGPFRVGLWSLSGGLPGVEIEGGTAYHYPAATGVNLVRYMFSTAYTLQNFAIVLNIETGGSTTNRWFGGLKTSTADLRSSVFPEAYSANYNGTVWSADQTLVRPLQLIGQVDYSSGLSGGFPPTSFYRRMI